MSPSVAPETLAAVHQLYGAQSHLIDGGHARDWALTFTADGEFVSPSYPEPVTGTGALTAFAERFAAEARARDEVTRHVLTNLFVREAGERHATVEAYLQIVTTPRGEPSRLVRQTTITDDLVHGDGGWRIRRRVVRRDDQPQ
ncbi:nuclear transport factor 2 family protein [Prauserella flavalba]|uniref:nuclear transport factor 2 family protein n=1 Tax=Prauserella flavalba TaxID=1477506 RepID=UPI0036E1A23F